MKRIKRNGIIYNVLDETDTEYVVESIFDYANPPKHRKLKMWWDKKYCKLVKDEDE